MNSNSDFRWHLVAKWLRITGAICFFGVFVGHFAVLAYFESHRPETPQLKAGLTTGLTWTHPVRYGRLNDERLSQWLFELGVPAAFVLMVGSELIKIYKLGDYSGVRGRPNPPWDHRAGP
jgi:hypothetical protein